MKILLIQAWLGPSKEYPVYPLGLAYLATMLEIHGHEPFVFDPNMADRPIEDIKRKIQACGPDAIGISLRNIDNQQRKDLFYYYKYFQKTLNAVDQVRKNALVIVGGPGFSIFPGIIMQRNPSIDLGVHLEAEESLPELLSSLSKPSQIKGVYYRTSNRVKYTGPAKLPDFKSLPIPKRHFLDPRPYADIDNQGVGIQTKRGCPLNCVYCVYPYLSGGFWRIRSPESVAEEIEYLRKDFDVRRIIFADSVVNLPYDFSRILFELLKKQKNKTEWVGYMHVKGVTREYLNLCVESGCKALIFSPDALSSGALKGLQKDISPEEIKELVNILKNQHLSLPVFYGLFINPPGETFSGLSKTLWFYLKHKISGKNRSVGINWIRVEPNSDIYKLALNEGVLSPETDLLPHDPACLDYTFYSKPGLRLADPVLKLLFRIIAYTKKSNT